MNGSDNMNMKKNIITEGVNNFLEYSERKADLFMKCFRKQKNGVKQIYLASFNRSSLFSEIPGSFSRNLLKNSVKIFYIFISNLCCNVNNFFISIIEHSAGFLNPDFLSIFKDCHPGTVFKELTEIVSAEKGHHG